MVKSVLALVLLAAAVSAAIGAESEGVRQFIEGKMPK